VARNQPAPAPSNYRNPSSSAPQGAGTVRNQVSAPQTGQRNPSQPVQRLNVVQPQGGASYRQR
jgi:hypothetical protein